MDTPSQKPSIKVYVAGTIHDPHLQATCETLEVHGHTVVSQWHRPGRWQGETKRQAYSERQRIAVANFDDLDRCDVVLALPVEGQHLRGMHTEIGYAIAKGIQVVVRGIHTDLNTMTVHPLVGYVNDLQGFLDVLEACHAEIAKRGLK